MGVLLVFFMINVFVIISMANLKKGSLTDIVWLAPDQFVSARGGEGGGFFIRFISKCTSTNANVSSND